MGFLLEELGERGLVGEFELFCVEVVFLGLVFDVVVEETQLLLEFLLFYGVVVLLLLELLLFCEDGGFEFVDLGFVDLDVVDLGAFDVVEFELGVSAELLF